MHAYACKCLPRVPICMHMHANACLGYRSGVGSRSDFEGRSQNVAEALYFLVDFGGFFILKARPFWESKTLRFQWFFHASLRRRCGVAVASLWRRCGIVAASFAVCHEVICLSRVPICMHMHANAYLGCPFAYICMQMPV